jgi:hypothetical protein
VAVRNRYALKCGRGKYILGMFIPSPPPPEPQQRITAVDVSICPHRDPKCYIEHMNDVFEALANSIQSSGRGFNVSGSDVVASTDTGRATPTGYTPEIILGPAGG